MIRSFFYKLLISVFTFAFILSAVYFMCGGKAVTEDIRMQSLAKKNSKNISDEVTLPKMTAKADRSVMRTEPKELTEEDLRSVYIGGKRFDFPCTLAELDKEYDVFIWSRGYDEKLDIYSGSAAVCCNGIQILTASFHCPDKDMPFDKCVTTRLYATLVEHSEEYTPQIVFAGMDIHNTDNEEMSYLTGLKEPGYIMNSDIYFPIDGKYKGYVSVNADKGYSHRRILERIEYIPDYDEENIDELKRNKFAVTVDTIKLPEDYATEKYPGIPSEEYPEIIFNGENITPDIQEYGMTAYELMSRAGIDTLNIYDDWSVEDNPEYRVIQCSLEENRYRYVWILLKDGQKLGEAAVFSAARIMK